MGSYLVFWVCNQARRRGRDGAIHCNFSRSGLRLHGHARALPCAWLRAGPTQAPLVIWALQRDDPCGATGRKGVSRIGVAIDCEYPGCEASVELNAKALRCRRLSGGGRRGAPYAEHSAVPIDAWEGATVGKGATVRKGATAQERHEKATIGAHGISITPAPVGIGCLEANAGQLKTK